MDSKVIQFFEANNCYIRKHNGIVTRCPFCGDSQKPGHLVGYGQFYIFDDGFSKCFRCGKYVPNSLAIKQIARKTNQEIPTELEFLVKTSDSTIVLSDSEINIEYDTDIQNYPEKINYLKKRTYQDTITEEYIIQNKIVLNLNQFKFIKKNTDDFIGFVTLHNNRLVLRNIYTKQYIHYSLTKQFQPDYYTSIDFLEKFIEHRTVVMGEGVFSILSTKLQKYFSKYPLVAALSKNSFYSAAKRIYLDTCLKYKLIVLKEKDVSLNDLKQLHLYCKKFTTKFEVYENVFGKDTGEERLVLKKCL